MSVLESAVGLGGRIFPSPKGRLLILIYHRVHAETDLLFPREITAEVFDWQMDLIRHHLTPLPLEEAIERWRLGTLPPRAVAVTFDDGYADNYTVALPILKRHAVPATFFITTGYLNGGRMWNDTIIETVRRLPPGPVDLGVPGVGDAIAGEATQRRLLCNDVIKRVKHLEQNTRQAVVDRIASLSPTALPEDLMMVDEQVRGLAAEGMGIGGHTSTHPILKSLDAEAAREEIVRGKVELEDLLGDHIHLFAYPNGKPGSDYGDEHVALVASAGFDAAVSTTRGVVGEQSDVWQLPRFTPWDRSRHRFLARVMLEYRNVA